MAKKGGLGTGVNTLLRGSASQRKQQVKRAAERAEQQEPDVVDLTEAASGSGLNTRQQPGKETIKQSAAAATPSAIGNSDSAPTDGAGGQLQHLPIDSIQRGTYQPRQQFDEEALLELADSITAQGLIQPILVRPYAGGYELVAGERRWRAARLAKLSTIPALVREIDDQSVASVALIENIQRKDLNPLEEAHALQRLQAEFSMTHEAVAQSIGRSRAAVTNLLRLLDLGDEVKQLLLDGELDMGHARALLGAPVSQQYELALQVIKRGLSVRATEKLVRELRSGERSTGKRGSSKEVDPDIAALQRDLGQKLAARVEIHHKEGGAGKLEISYNSLDELEGILGHIK